MGAECSMFVKELGKKLSKKRNEELNVKMCWLRTKISFLCQRAALLCYFGYFGYFGMFEESPQLSTSGSARLLVTIQSNKLLLLAAM